MTELFSSINNFSFVYCLAGKVNRFIQQGVYDPKFLLYLNNDLTILETSLKSFNFPVNSHIVLVINKDHAAFSEKINAIVKNYTNNYDIIITKDTRGQAETAYLSLSKINPKNWIFFFNGDTVLLKRNLTQILKHISQSNDILGYIDIFEENSSNYSYVITNNDDIVTDIKEKEPISVKATSGLYGFINKNIYEKYYKILNFQDGEVFISDVYMSMLKNNGKILVSPLFKNIDSIILGTPEEYKLNKNKF